ncbi:hypothetical protein HOD19_00890 [bacterium]|jgi:hypothetical protein|nr:hypothetical protein [bacterium]MBT4649275.1 hypothetical protein [bacterium]
MKKKKGLIAISLKARRLHGCPHCSHAYNRLLTSTSLESVVKCLGCGQDYAIERLIISDESKKLK